MNTLLLDALNCKNQKRPPVWLMRQAGRYLPEYRALREKYTLWHLFHNPQLAAEITLQPINLLGVDAAILFSDILLIAEAFGFQVAYPEGESPRIIPKITPYDPLEIRNVEETLSYVKETIILLKPELKVPLIGFCGGPFTLATYMMGKAEEWVVKAPEQFHQFLDTVTKVLISYLRIQIDAGVDAVQVFDSWANLLSPLQVQEFSHRYLNRIVDALRITGVPIILFCRGSSNYPTELAAIGSSAISFDWHKEMQEIRKSVPQHIAVQGNLDPEFLQRATLSEIISKTRHLKNSMKDDPGFIANLGHGVLPKTPVENVRAFIDVIKNPF